MGVPSIAPAGPVIQATLRLNSTNEDADCQDNAAAQHY